MIGKVRNAARRIVRMGRPGKAAVLLGVGVAAVVGARIAAAGDPACDPASIRERVAALEAEYDAMPELTDPEAIYERSQRFEEEWQALGALCERPNGLEPEPPLGAADHEVELDRVGIWPPAPPGQREVIVPGSYEVINRWSGLLEGQPYVVDAVIQTIRMEGGGPVVERRWGLLVETPDGGFYEAPEGLGPLTIVGGRDLVLTLEAEDGRRVAFDVLRREWVDPDR